jgi:hypothetical protein
MKKELFKTEVRKIRDMRNSLSLSQKLNGTQVILNETNRNKLKEVEKLLSYASNLLAEIQ